MTLCENQVYVCILWQHYYARYLLLNIHIKQKIKSDDFLMMLLGNFFFSCRLRMKSQLYILATTPLSSFVYLFHPVASLHPILPSTCHFLYITCCYLPSPTSPNMLFVRVMLPLHFFILQISLRFQCWLEMSCFLSCCDAVSCHFICCQIIYLSIGMFFCSSESPHLICPLGESKLWDKTMIK